MQHNVTQMENRPIGQNGNVSLEQIHLAQPQRPQAHWYRGHFQFIGKPHLPTFAGAGAPRHGVALSGIVFGMAAWAENREGHAVRRIVREMHDVEEAVRLVAHLANVAGRLQHAQPEFAPARIVVLSVFRSYGHWATLAARGESRSVTIAAL